MWLASQDRRGDDQIFIGEAFKLPDGGCIHGGQPVKSKGWIAGTEFTAGYSPIAVKWWIKSSDDAEERTYEEWQPTARDIEMYGIETEDGV